MNVNTRIKLTKYAYTLTTTKQVAELYQDFFNFLHQEHGIIATVDQMNEIVYEAQKLSLKLESFKNSQP